MVILGIESSAPSASAAVVKEGKLLSHMYLNVGLTHSATLMPLILEAVKGAGLTPNDIEAVAVSQGPGSFTGVRIGVAAAKGIAQPRALPCIPVSTLETIAYPLTGSQCIALSVMDARCNQVYCAAFDCCGSHNTRLLEDSALPLGELLDVIKNYNKKIILIGDGTEVAYNFLKDKIEISAASPLNRYQNAASVALIAEEMAKNGNGLLPCGDLVPAYLRMPQAERELKKRQSEKQ